MSTLDLINLRKQFGDVIAVNDLNLNVGDGEFLCILGPSGCGKSTALRMIAGFEDPTAGDVLIDKQSVANMPPNRRPTAMVFQKYTLWPHMRVYDNIAFGLKLRRLPKVQIDKEVYDSLELVGLKGYGERYPAQLSGGEQQRVAIARALVLKPKILLLDEPFSNLDALLRVRLREELRLIQRRMHITAVFVTHDQEEALSLADRIAVMNKGNLEQIDQPSELYARPRSLFVADFIGAMNMLQGNMSGGVLRVNERAMTVPSGVGTGMATIAIRPEDVVLTTAGDPAAWHGRTLTVSDLGHYRKVLAEVDGIGPMKLYLPKSADVGEDAPITFRPTRYLVYQGGNAAPIEVRT